MPEQRHDRRQWFKQTALAAATGSLALGTAAASRTAAAEEPVETPAGRIRYSLNASTINGFALPVPEQIDIAAEVGYDAIELWVGSLRGYLEKGGDLKRLKAQIDEAGMTVPNLIGFARWGVDDPAVRAEGMKGMRSDMELAAALGCGHIAAPAAGAPREQPIGLDDMARRYAELVDIGRPLGVRPLLEVWGASTTLGTLAQVVYVAAASQRPEAGLLLDAYHLYRGGSDFDGLRLLSGRAMPIFHMNDYPADPPREQLGDGHRIFPGDGVCPLVEVVRVLLAGGFDGILSLELFNSDYWKRDALEVAREGLEKMRRIVAAAEEKPG